MMNDQDKEERERKRGRGTERELRDSMLSAWIHDNDDDDDDLIYIYVCSEFLKISRILNEMRYYALKRFGTKL